VNKKIKIQEIRERLKRGENSIGTWMQIPHSSIAEVLGRSGYDWVVIDLEHGSVSVHQLPDLFRALELGKTLPIARLAQASAKDCKQALDAGAGGVIIPMVESAEQLKAMRSACCWPPEGTRGVGFSRANLFGKNFDSYNEEAQNPIVVAQIENIRAVENLPEILEVDGLDATLIGPYDLSASMGITAEFEHPDFIAAMDRIRTLSKKKNVPCGVHSVSPLREQLNQRIEEGYQFLAYSIDAVLLGHIANNEKS